ncbi:E3 ubiquitin-protein ligase ZNRF1 isoform X1 [Meleagris gallopavo]|uniref:E3 ubiquitin-protein ligase ZNRF1 isoform X1 n=1 Tax=Meleagris gallopavo TaxID=9103 RepID=UPI000549A001|nr:E3 ubiquitin-protein ligase ZNRF1 isoform X1 [Meleagris gallopavo]
MNVTRRFPDSLKNGNPREPVSDSQEQMWLLQAAPEEALSAAEAPWSCSCRKLCAWGLSCCCAAFPWAEPGHPCFLPAGRGAFLLLRSSTGSGENLRGFKCPICSKSVASDEMEMHFIMCLSKPRLSYNDDVLTKDAGECVICLEELLQGDTIARLPCLCIYHKSCIDSWFEVNRSCPEHPSD